MGESFIFAGLAGIASASPLLTLAWLWQVKEWRWRRLTEHLRRERWFRQLFGRVRPLAVALTLAMMWIPAIPRDQALLGGLTLLAALTAAQIGLNKQRYPVWTQKARILVAATLGVTILLAVCAAWPSGPVPEELLPLLPLLQPLLLLIAWACFWPLDRALKNRVMHEARRLRMKNPGLQVIAITGSVGKTTTKELLAHVLSVLRPLATPAHVNTEIGVAQWMTMELPRYIATLPSPASVRGAGGEGGPAGREMAGILIVEMGAYQKGEIALMSSYAQQTMAVVTHVGTQHIALFGSQQALYEAKSEIVTALPKNGRAFLNGDNDLCRKMAELSPCPVTIVGTGGSADLEALDIEETPAGIRMTVDGTPLSVPIHGTHNVTNVLLAVAVAKQLGLDMETIARRLSSFQPPSRTFQVRESNGVRILDDTYNAGGASVKAAIAWARTQPYEEKTLLFAGLIEMGEEQERTEIDLGEQAAQVFGRVIVIDPLSAKNVQKGFGKPVELLTSSPARVRPGSLLVCVGRMPASSINCLLPSPQPQPQP